MRVKLPACAEEHCGNVGVNTVRMEYGPNGERCVAIRLCDGHTKTWLDYFVTERRNEAFTTMRIE